MTRALLVACIGLAATLAGCRQGQACSVENVSVAFTVYDVYAKAPLDATGAIRYVCPAVDSAAPPALRISLGEAADGSFDRRMVQGQESLRYNLYLDPPRTIVWGDGSRGTQAHTSSCCETVTTATIYGRIFPAQDVAAGSYQDSVVVTVEF